MRRKVIWRSGRFICGGRTWRAKLQAVCDEREDRRIHFRR